MRTTSLCRAARRHWMATWRKATTVWWIMAKAATVSSTRTALSSASTRWRRTRTRRRATRALRPPRPSMPSTRWRSAVAAHGGTQWHPLIRGHNNKPQHHTPDTNTHTWILYINIWNTLNTEETQQGLSGDCVGFPLQIKQQGNTGVELDHKPLFYVSSSKKLAPGRWRLDKVDSARFPLRSACPLPTQTWSVPSGQLSALGGINKHSLEIFLWFVSAPNIFRFRALLPDTPLIPLCSIPVKYTQEVPYTHSGPIL